MKARFSCAIVRIVGIACTNISPSCRSEAKLSLPPSHQSYIRAECGMVVSIPGGAHSSSTCSPLLSVDTVRFLPGSEGAVIRLGLPGTIPACQDVGDRFQRVRPPTETRPSYDDQACWVMLTIQDVP